MSVCLLLFCYIHYFFNFLDATNMWFHTVFVFVWRISLNIMPSKSTNVVANVIISFFFKGQVVFHSVEDTYKYTYIYIYIFFIHSSLDGYLGYFHVLATVNNAAKNIGMHVYFQISISLFFWRYTRRGISGS